MFTTALQLLPPNIQRDSTHTEVEEGSELSEDGVRSDGGRAGESLQNSFHCLDLSS